MTKSDGDGDGSDGSFSMLTIGLVDGAFDEMIAIDTGAQEDVVILTNSDAVKSMTPRAKTIATADKKGKLRVSHECESGEWKKIIYRQICHSQCFQVVACAPTDTCFWTTFLLPS